jgi:hypothetical protein
MGRTAAATFAFLAGVLLLSGCQKKAPEQPAAAPKPVVAVAQVSSNAIIVTGDDKVQSNLKSRDLGAVTLTNHLETCVRLGPDKDCLVTPVVIDSHTVQLTLTVESRKPNGKMHDLSITQVVTKSGKPFEVAVGEFNFSLTPNVTSE